MESQTLLNISFVEVKCPCCGRHLDKFKVVGHLSVSRKCKSCKNNILTDISDNKIVSNKIDALENSKDIITPNRFQSGTKSNRNPFKDNQKS